MYLKDSIDTSGFEISSPSWMALAIDAGWYMAAVALIAMGVMVVIPTFLEMSSYSKTKDKAIATIFCLFEVIMIAGGITMASHPAPSQVKYNTQVEARDKETKNAKNLISKAAMEQYEIKEAKAQSWSYKHVRNVVSETATDAPILHVLTSDNKLQKVHVEYDNATGEVTFISSAKSDAPLPQRKK